MTSAGERDTPTVTEDRPSVRSRFVGGVRLGAGPAAATFVLALTYGAAAQRAGWGLWRPLVLSMAVFSGSAQFTLLTTLSAGGVMAATAAAVLINARYLVMSVALNDSLRGGRPVRAVQGQALVDASFVLAHRGGGRFDVPVLMGATLVQWTCWVAGTAMGALLAPSAHLLHALGLDVVFPAFFLLLAVDELRGSRRAIRAAVLGAGICAALLFVVAPGTALLGATAAALLGLAPDRSRPAPEGES